MAQRFLYFLVAHVGVWVVRLYFTTVRILAPTGSRERLMRQRGGLCGIWHSHQLVLAWGYRGAGVASMISQSKDGEYIARIAKALGQRPVRGSSSRGGFRAMTEMIHLIRGGHFGVITPDGPRGPRYTIHSGILLIAQRTGQPIIPMAVGLSRFWELPSWDRFRVPKPFSRGLIVWGEPFPVPADATKEDRAILADKLAARMRALEADADRMVDGGM